MALGTVCYWPPCLLPPLPRSWATTSPLNPTQATSTAGESCQVQEYCTTCGACWEGFISLLRRVSGGQPAPLEGPDGARDLGGGDETETHSSSWISSGLGSPPLPVTTTSPLPSSAGYQGDPSRAEAIVQDSVGDVPAYSDRHVCRQRSLHRPEPVIQCTHSRSKFWKTDQHALLCMEKGMK